MLEKAMISAPATARARGRVVRASGTAPAA
jgi:hypothetical protein